MASFGMTCQFLDRREGKSVDSPSWRQLKKKLFFTANQRFFLPFLSLKNIVIPNSATF